MQGRFFKRSLGQCFLRDTSLALRIARILRPLTDHLVEVGGGSGMLTQALQSTYPGRSLWVVEIDAHWAEVLRRRFPHVTVVETDFLHWDAPAQIGTSYSVMGNFPYSISGPLAIRVVTMVQWVPFWGGMWQEEVARRLVADPGTKDYGILSVLVGAFYRAELLFRVSPSAFYPRPKVWSALTRFYRRPILPAITPADLLHVLQHAFRHRRKKLRNNLPGEWLDAVEDLKLADLRAEQVDVDTWITATERFATLQRFNNRPNAPPTSD